MRRALLLLLIVLIPALAFAGGQQEGAPTTEAAQDPDVMSEQTEAPSENVLNFPALLGGTYMDWMKTVYNKAGAPDVAQIPMAAYDKNFELHPIAAESWEVSEDGLTWTFNLREDLLWSDGEPLTARDFEFALERAVTQGYDFGWYWSWAGGIANWGAVESGDAPLSELGVEAVDDNTLTLTTNAPKPYLPGVTAFLFPVPEHVVEEHGDEWASSAENYVSSGPFMLTEWVRGDRYVLEKNPNYNGPWPAQADRINLYPALGDPAVGFPAYLAGDLDMTDLNTGQLAYAEERMPEQLKSGTFFGIYYLAYDYDEPPFDNVDVRRALFYAVDRNELTSTVLNKVAVPARALFAPGYPGYSNEIAEQTEFDPEKAREHLAKAGYPDGEGFPEVELWWRIEGGIHAPIVGPLAEYLQAQFKEVLNIDVGIEGKELKTWMDAQANRDHNFFLAPYMKDYIDPSNFASIFVNGGRHHWTNDEYTRLVEEANSTFEMSERLELYRQAEQILIDRATVTYLVHPMTNKLLQSYVAGEASEPNEFGDFLNVDPFYIWTHLHIDGQM